MTLSSKIVIWLGGAALLAATAIDTLAVLGRHLGLPVTGSIELMQAAVLVSGSIGLLVSTIYRSHARVRLIVDRLPPSWRSIADRCSDGLTLLFVLALLAGSVWLSVDLWNAHEESELLGVPWRVLRLFANACLLAICAVLTLRIVRRAGE
ncbi:TRAP transporter small permease subunit [Novosphingobium sp. KN65.2]|uniref:TRAP transporter small permease subunit n=1 Tax=Novosphingobium sp. KN65.2 TaxID=1478134 RepID=UPI0005E7E8EC|nr:TRAP transporter small permease subunit [Novosphingobium sp. KN65.2]CDO34912.1 putative TRAP-type C4-dicarboxylate transport system, small permease component [Novosphingobium sp. KN65.2]